jgi:hypothetical protein
VLVEEVAQGVPDRRLLEEPRRHLVEQRLKGVVVVFVDKHDVDIAFAKLLGGSDTAEAATKDKYPRAPAVGVLSSGHE